MLSNLFAPSPPLDETSVDWIFQVFGWSLRNLDGAYFRDHTILVNPTNEHFAGRTNSVGGMAELIFRTVAGYAGMAHWPLRLTEATAVVPALTGPVRVNGPLRAAAPARPPASGSALLTVPYEPALVANPEALIAGLAQNLAHHLGASVREPPPGGLENWPQTTEVIGVFLGFGLMFANTAFEFQRRSCGSCGGPAARREAFLSQYDITYALALFATLKRIPQRDVLRHLKSSLRGHYKRCARDLRPRSEAVEALHAA
jgi:hypothetical protein